MKSTLSTIPSGSTSSSCSTLQASLRSRICRNSVLETCKSQSSSISFMICCSFSCTKLIIMLSFSVEATPATTSQSTPINMFMMVSAEMRIKRLKTTKQTRLSSSKALQIPARSSSKVPCTHKVNMDFGTFGKYSSPATSTPSANSVRAIANMYIMMMRRAITKNTDRMAATIPLIRIMSSGMERSILAMRESLSSRKSRRIEVPPKPELPELPMLSMIAGNAQVSRAIIKTRQESNMNQPSLSPSRFLLNDMYLINHSREKYRQKKCSPIWNTGSASRSADASLASVSIAIHNALSEITASVTFSKSGLRAIACQMPVL
mmetsp:Transcript_91688/g.186652  ORF Transcript_91688/g.186652 Transcript_91688/m.186652 type:complete len:320 (-) Transcript_91688:377-1336(-)